MNRDDKATPVAAFFVVATLAVAAWLVAGLSLRPAAAADLDHTQVATFAGGCFWCMEHPFEKLPGVVQVLSGYAGGSEKNPTYTQVGSGRTGHAEVIQVRYDPATITYATLLDVFWRQIDPTDAGGQFIDRGRQYRPAIFFHNSEQQSLAQASKKALAASGRFLRPIVVEILPAGAFYLAEEVHQDFYKKSQERYQRYRSGSGRDPFLDRVWGDERVPASVRALQQATQRFDKPSDAQLRQRLTRLQYEVTQRQGTERPFANSYWDNKKPGIYVDVVSGEPLFSSLDKYDSGTGWPSFTRPLETANIVERTDSKLGVVRTELRSKHGDSHLGHLFADGPAPTGLRYCINSAALRFIPAGRLETEGYGEYARLFD